MSQYLKDEVRERIDRAALDEFALRGFRAATIAAVARRASISAGNIYRYYADKEALFDGVMPPSFASGLLRMLRRRIRALEGVANLRTLDRTSPFQAISEELLQFAIANRLRVVILLGRAADTRYGDFSDRLVDELARLAVRHFRGLEHDVPADGLFRAALEQIYRNWITTLVEILSANTDEGKIRERVALFSRYHLAGLNGLFRQA